MYKFECPKCSARNLTVRAYVWCYVDQSDLDGTNISMPLAKPGDWDIDPDWDNGEMCCEDCEFQAPAHQFRTGVSPAPSASD